ncbi:hypothetical protein IDJ81_13680 [Tsuneonella flava]|uniref:Uncharacterized protein n=1 Tax=Tsuneonella flava TaxID=2055955 RepID=A0ABX7KAK4_9SPHN|nr:hypothetical protein [Tsuneonella flava]QSB44347.1 hypothetical protein IDJ81_13680 [Tsuneonella flava]
MRTFLTIGLALAVLAAVAKLIALAIILAAIVAVLTRPRELLAVATTVGVLHLFALYPVPMLAVAGGIIASRVKRYRGSAPATKIANHDAD